MQSQTPPPVHESTDQRPKNRPPDSIFSHETGVPKIEQTVARTTALSTTTSIKNGTKSQNCGGSNLSHVEALAAPHGSEQTYDKLHFSRCYTGTPGVTLKIAYKLLINNSLEREKPETTKFPA